MYARHIDQSNTSVDVAAAGRKPQRSRSVLYAILLAAGLYAVMAAVVAVSGMLPFSHVTGQDEATSAMSIFMLLGLHLLICAVGGYLVGRLGRRTHGDYNNEKVRDDLRSRDRTNVAVFWGAAAVLTILMLSGGARAVVSDAVGFGSVSAAAASLPQHGTAPVQEHAMVANSGDDFSAPDAIIWTSVALVLSAVAANYCATFGALQRDGMRLDLRKLETRQRDLRNR